MTDPEQQEMIAEGATPAPSAVLSGPWVKRCENAGPYVWERWTAKLRRQYVIMKCCRPADHDGDHAWTNGVNGLTHWWNQLGNPIRPLPIREK